MVVSLTALSCSALCAAGALALAPSPAFARPGTDLPRPMASQTPYLQRAGTQVRTRSDAPALPDISALSWVVADSGTGEVLAAHDAHLKLPPASTLKTLFALTVLPALPAGIQHTVKEEELEGIGDGSSLVGVAAGTPTACPTCGAASSSTPATTPCTYWPR